MIRFRGNEHAGHTSCISEAQKFHKSVYQGEKGDKKKGKQEKKTAATKVEPMEGMSMSGRVLTTLKG